jgi:DNA-binding MarR family transcriptional regulator
VASGDGLTDELVTLDEQGIAEISLGIRRLQRLLSSRRVHSRLAAVAGVTLSQQALQVLGALTPDGPRSVADVARAAHMDVAAVSRQLGALEDEQLVRRATSASNASVVLVEATPRGRRVVSQLEAVRTRHFREALAAWTPAERITLGQLLLRLVDDLPQTPYRETTETS